MEVIVRRSLVIITLTICVTFGVTSVAHAAGTAKGVIDEPCTLLTVQQVEKAFGGPVADPIFQAQYSFCEFDVGDVTEPPGGVVLVSQLFPNFSQSEDTPKAAYADQRAVDELAGYELTDVSGVGKRAYLNLNTGTIVFQTKAMLLAIQWQPGKTPTEPSESEQRSLVKLAKHAAKRAPTK